MKAKLIKKLKSMISVASRTINFWKPGAMGYLDQEIKLKVLNELLIWAREQDET